MHGIALLADGIALLCLAAALGASLILYDIWKTRVLQLYVVFISTIAAFMLSTAALNVAEAAGQLEAAPALIRLLRTSSVIVQAFGGVVHVAVLPHFVYAVNNRHPSQRVQHTFYTIAAVMVLLAITFLLRPEFEWIGFLLTAILFSSIGWCIARMLGWLRRMQPNSSDLDTSRALRGFVWLSLCFLPLFVADFVVSQTEISSFFRHFDGVSVPAYLIALAVGSIRFAKAKLGMPALYRDEQLTSYCRERFSLTRREAEVVEFVMEGYSLPDAASVLKISAKTAEHHLYSAYQKLSVTNRIQLFQTLMAHS